MKLIILGSGTSTGIPEVGCCCAVCRSNDTKDKRLRSSALVVTDARKHILIDCGPDFRQQALRHDIDQIDAILITHEHYDHVYGLDDLRTIAWNKTIPIYAKKEVLEAIKKRMHYVFCDNPYPGTPKFELYEIKDFYKSFDLFDTKVVPFPIQHGRLEILGFRINDICYITDMKTASTESQQLLLGADLIVINALRWCKEHPSHQSVLDVLTLVSNLKINHQQILLTHLSHHAPSYQELCDRLPPNIKPAFDGATILLKNKKITYTDMYKKEEPFETIICGRIKYAEAWALQHEIFNQILDNKKNNLPTKNKLLICEHNPVFTLGLHGKANNMLMSKEYLVAHGYEYFEVERGGDITYHGPGQITGYPIFDLEKFGIGIKKYIELLEESIIELLYLYGIKGERSPGATGVWLDTNNPQKARKICAIGVKCTRYVTMHGFALNVNNSLEPFTLINPCGFVEGKVTSIEKEAGITIDFTVVINQLTNILYKNFQALIL